MKASDIFVGALENEGVEYIFSIPGEVVVIRAEGLPPHSLIVPTVGEEDAGLPQA